MASIISGMSASNNLNVARIDDNEVIGQSASTKKDAPTPSFVEIPNTPRPNDVPSTLPMSMNPSKYTSKLAGSGYSYQPFYSHIYVPVINSSGLSIKRHRVQKKWILKAN
jgi:hypothetical protein